MREKLTGNYAQDQKAGITPASAGKTIVMIVSVGSIWDHPRECGKNFLGLLRLPLDLGSPPRVREKHIRVVPSEAISGITPASAGKTKQQNQG